MENRNGFVLITTIMVLALLTLLGLSGIKLATIDLAISGNVYCEKKAFFNAESGTIIGLNFAQIIHDSQKDSYDYINNPNVWKVTFTERGEIKNHNGDLICTFDKSNTPFIVEITMIVDILSNDVLYYGGNEPIMSSDPNIPTIFPPYQYWANSSTKDYGRPYYKITSIGYNSRRLKRGEQIVQTIVRPKTDFLPVNTALYLNGSLLNNGSGQSILGEGDPTRLNPCNGYDIICTNDSINQYTGNFNVCDFNPCDTNAPSFITDASPYPVDELVNSLIASGTDVINPSTPIFGNDPSDIDRIYYIIGDLDLNNLDGYGTLVVKGNLEITGGIGWHGLIVVTGNSVLKGGGNSIIYGSFINGGDILLNGTPDIYYDCDLIEELYNRHKSYKQNSWQHVIRKFI